MFRTEDMIIQLWALAKHGLFVNHQERELVKSAAQRLKEQAASIVKLQKENAQLRMKLEYVNAEREGIRDEEKLAASLPEDYWEDMWPETE